MVEAKNTKDTGLPNLEDIKDGLLRMILFTNLEEATIKGKDYKITALLKLTSLKGPISESEKNTLRTLEKEADINSFKVEVNSKTTN